MHRPSFHRVIEIRTVGNSDSGTARVALEDDYHHFRVQLTFAAGKVCSAEGTALRTPYSLCGNATAQLAKLRGMPLSPDDSAVTVFTNQRMQCTHMLDEAGLGIAAAARNIRSRRYAIEVPRHIDGETEASLDRDGLPVMGWRIRDGIIEAPQPFTGQAIGRGFSRWAAEHLDQDEREAALVLRRCAMISLGRLHDLDAITHARPSGNCYVQQADRALQALRVIGSTHDFSARQQQLCATDRDWLDELEGGS